VSKKCHSFEAASRQCMDAVYTRAIRLTKDATTAEKLVQMTFLKAFHAFKKNGQINEFKQGLLILLNELYNEHFTATAIEMQLPHQRLATVH